MKKLLQILNGIAFVSVVFINYLSNTGAMNGKTIGSISDNINSLFTPAGYAFSIWGLIYLLLLGFVIFQGRRLFTSKKLDDDFIEKIGVWFVVSCIANIAWIFSWIYGYTGLSCVFIFLLLFSLLKIVLKLTTKLENVSTLKWLFIQLPFIIYSGWVTVASIANVSSYLVKINWDGFGLSSNFWAITMIIIAVIVNSIVLYRRKLYAFALVAVWALIAIGVANKNKENNIDLIAFLGAADLLLSTIVLFFKSRKNIETT